MILALERLPEYIWVGLIFEEYGRKKAWKNVCLCIGIGIAFFF